MLISVDAGKDTTKSYSKLDGICLAKQFSSKVYDITSNGDIIKAGNTSRVIFQGNEYLIGDSGTDQDYSTSKINDYNKLCQYLAITQHIEPGKLEKIDLITGIPAAHYKNKDLRNKYTENIRGEGRISITVDEKNYVFEFNSIKVRPEGSGITALRPDLFNQKNTLVIDLGGQNMNIVLFNDFAFDPSKMISENAGGTTIEQSIINELSTKGIENVNQPIVRFMMKNKGIQSEDFQTVIDNTINKYIQLEIMKTLGKNNMSIALYDVVFVGGTSFVLKSYLEKYFNDAIFMENMEEAQFANCKGFYKMGEL